MFSRKKFREINLEDHFFDSLKRDYVEFPVWFARKADEYAYVLSDDDTGAIQGFLYLKSESGPLTDVNPPLPPAQRIKVGTLKINAHGTKLGERFLKKIFDHAISEAAAEIYVTVFRHHEGLVNLLQRYGFEQQGEKVTNNGTELVLVRNLRKAYVDVLESYPLIALRGSAYLLSLQPQWHTRLLPDSILNNENARIVQDISHANSIHKVYLASMRGMENLRRGDVLVIYRTTDNQGPARFRSVATSICVVEEYRSLQSFGAVEDFLAYCRPYSVFTDDELLELWRHGRYQNIIRFTYNVAFDRRVTRGELIDEVGLDEDAYWGFMRLTQQQLTAIAEKGNTDASLIVH